MLLAWHWSCDGFQNQAFIEESNRSDGTKVFCFFLLETTAERRSDGTDEPGSNASVQVMLLKSPGGKMKMRHMPL